MGYVTKEQILLHEELCAKSIDRDDKVTQATIRFRENIKLAHKVVKNYKPSDVTLDYEDILQEAYYGLWLACMQFDESKGFQFSTYAVPMIRGYILKLLRDTEPMRTPRHYKSIRSALKRHGFDLPLTREQIDIILAEGVVTEEQLLEYKGIEYRSLDATLKDDTESTLADIIPSEMFSIKEDLSDEELEEAIEQIVSLVGRINDRNRDMIEEWLYSLIADEKLNQTELATKYGISQAHVSRILRHAIRVFKLKEGEVSSILGESSE